MTGASPPQPFVRIKKSGEGEVRIRVEGNPDTLREIERRRVFDSMPEQVLEGGRVEFLVPTAAAKKIRDLSEGDFRLLEDAMQERVLRASGSHLPEPMPVQVLAENRGQQLFSEIVTATADESPHDTARAFTMPRDGGLPLKGPKQFSNLPKVIGGFISEHSPEPVQKLLEGVGTRYVGWNKGHFTQKELAIVEEEARLVAERYGVSSSQDVREASITKTMEGLRAINAVDVLLPNWQNIFGMIAPISLGIIGAPVAMGIDALYGTHMLAFLGGALLNPANLLGLMAAGYFAGGLAFFGLTKAFAGGYVKDDEMQLNLGVLRGEGFTHLGRKILKDLQRLILRTKKSPLDELPEEERREVALRFVSHHEAFHRAQVDGLVKMFPLDWASAAGEQRFHELTGKLYNETYARKGLELARENIPAGDEEDRIFDVLSKSLPRPLRFLDKALFDGANESYIWGSVAYGYVLGKAQQELTQGELDPDAPENRPALMEETVNQMRKITARKQRIAGTFTARDFRRLE